MLPETSVYSYAEYSNLSCDPEIQRAAFASKASERIATRSVPPLLLIIDNDASERLFFICKMSTLSLSRETKTKGHQYIMDRFSTLAG